LKSNDTPFALSPSKGVSRIFRHPLRRKGARGLGLLVLLLLPFPVRADLTRCHTALQSEISSFTADVGKAIQSCAVSIRRARGMGDHLSRAADQCDRSLMKVYNAAGVQGRSALDRLRAGVERLHPVKCSDNDLLAMGYFVPGINAPGTRGPCSEKKTPCKRDSDCTARNDFCPGAMGDVIRRAVAEADTAARRAQLRALPDLAELIDAVIHLQPGGEHDLGTEDCSQPASSPPPSASYRRRPNLCRLAPYLPCVSRQCSLSVDSSITLAPLDLPIRVVDQTLSMDVCAPTDSSDVLLFSAVSQILVPPPLMPLDPPITACVEVVNAQGWCDCSSAGQGAPFMPQLCIDHIIDAQGEDECGASAQLLDDENECGCASIAGQPQMHPLPPCSTAACDVCVRRGSDAPCHPATRNGPLHEEWTGASAAGDCAVQSSLRISFLPPAFCRAADGGVRGVCAAAGPADATCTALGGTTCRDARGPNGSSCDGDDETPWTLFPLRAALTTGTSKARISDWVLSEGVCSGPGGMNCVEDGNCAAPATCATALFGCGNGPGANDCEVASGPGARMSCSSLLAGSAGGWKLVGSVPRIDQPAGLRDGLVTVTLQCE